MSLITMSRGNTSVVIPLSTFQDSMKFKKQLSQYNNSTHNKKPIRVKLYKRTVLTKAIIEVGIPFIY